MISRCRSGFAAFCIHFLVVSYLSPASAAGPISPMTDDDLVRNASLVFAGVVNHSEAQWNKAHTQIITTVTVHVGEWIKRPKNITQETVTFRTLGGIVGDVGQYVVGAPVYPRGAEMLLMLRPDFEQTLFPVVGFNLGRFVIDSGIVQGREISQRELVEKLHAIVMQHSSGRPSSGGGVDE